MKRIQPECFIEVWEYRKSKYNTKPVDIDYMPSELRKAKMLYVNIIAVFLIKRTTIPLAERLEARKVNNNLNQ